jgi:hypothetical protein
MSLVQIMGGVRLPPHTQLLRDASEFIAGVSFWIFVATVALCWIIQGRAALLLARTKTAAPWASATMAVVALAIWAAVAAPLQPQAANHHRLETFIRQDHLPQAVEFASARQRKDFLPSHDFPGGRSALALLELTTPETPAWLRQEWTSAAIQDLKTLSLAQYRDKEELEKIKRHPEIMAAIQHYAAELRSQQNRLEPVERWWLETYENLTETKPQK